MPPKRAAAELDTLTLAELREKAKDQGLLTRGNKQDLIGRLKASKKRPAPKASEGSEPPAKRGHQSPPKVKLAEVAAAQDLKAALGLTAAGARRLAALLQTLPKSELRRRLKVLQSPSEEQRQAVRTQKSDRLAAPRPPIPATAGELFGLPADSGRLVLKCLIFAEQNTLRAVGVGAKHLVDVEICRLAAAFTYKAELFDARLRCTRSGRVMGKGDAGRSRRFIGFLTRHAKLLQWLDVRHAPIDALESKILRLAIPSMKHLTEIHLPTEGWSSHADRQRLLSALPRSVTVKWSKELRSKWKESRSPKQEHSECQL